MLELLKFALESPQNFAGTIVFVMLFYALFGNTSLGAFKEFLAQKKEIETRKLDLEEKRLNQ
jgi:uncharacterized membrane protein